MEVFLVYLWLKLDTIITVFKIGMFLSLVAAGAIAGPMTDCFAKDEDGRYKKYCFRWLKLAMFLFLPLWVLTPSSKDTAILVGTSIAVDAAKSLEGEKVMTLLRGKANELLDEQIKLLEKKK